MASRSIVDWGSDWTGLTRPLSISDLTIPDELAALFAQIGTSSSEADRAIDPEFQQFCAGLSHHAPYLYRLILKIPDALAPLAAAIRADEAEMRNHRQSIWRRAAASASQLPALEAAIEAHGSVPIGLRKAKARAHLWIALADLWEGASLDETTAALSDFADNAVRLALQFAQKSTNGEPIPGFFALALGKLGSRMLNYSSDIDICVFYDKEICPLSAAEAVTITQHLVDCLMRYDEHGYVLRVDLRLRPDPGATAIAMSCEAAERYYESYGQNWERAAFIKARFVAGDPFAAERFLRNMDAFIWRRHLDHAALADIHSIKRQINSHGGHLANEPGFDVKLGHGGIREIEFFVEVQQLIFGGRYPDLRVANTRSALRAMVAFGQLSIDIARDLSQTYEMLRGLEHRAQMRHDEQTHRIPKDDRDRLRFAQFCGFSSLAMFDEANLALRRTVQVHYRALFAEDDDLSDPLGSLVFTGVDDDPETLETIARLGFAKPPYVTQTVRDWHRGRLRATRSARARELLTHFIPRLLRAASQTGDPDLAFEGFGELLARLPAGVEILSMLNQRVDVLASLLRLMSIHPNISRLLGRKATVLDSLLDPSFDHNVIDLEPGARQSMLHHRLGNQTGLEAHMNETRRFAREERFRILRQVLDGLVSPDQAANAYSDLAENCVDAMARAVLKELEARMGPAPGRVLIGAFGKMGGRELSEGSDLDLIIIYDNPDHEGPLEALSQATAYYTRFAQRLISALASPTQEGILYPIDLQLRPSGKVGPVAVRFSAFSSYYYDEAWVWELLALTRFRVIWDPWAWSSSVQTAALRALQKPRDRAGVLADIQAMREKMAMERKASDFWDLKLNAGGMVDLEFIIQSLQLMHGAHKPDILRSHSGEALINLVQNGICAADYRLHEAWQAFRAAQQILRIVRSEESSDNVLSPGTDLSPNIGRILAEALHVPDITAASDRIQAHRDDILRARADLLGF